MGADQSTLPAPAAGGPPSDPAARAALVHPRALVIVGPSGVGKGTLIARLRQDASEAYGFSVSHTTRQPRPGEKHGEHYFFTTKEQFAKEVGENKFLEYAEVHGNLYGTSIKAVQTVLEAGRVCLLDIDVQGARQVRASGLRSIFVFLAPPSLEDLAKRLKGRGTETAEAAERRLNNAKHEMESLNERPSLYDYLLVNDNLEECLVRLRHVAERCAAGLDAEPGQVPEKLTLASLAAAPSPPASEAPDSSAAAPPAADGACSLPSGEAGAGRESQEQHASSAQPNGDASETATGLHEAQQPVAATTSGGGAAAGPETTDEPSAAAAAPQENGGAADAVAAAAVLQPLVEVQSPPQGGRAAAPLAYRPPTPVLQSGSAAAIANALDKWQGKVALVTGASSGIGWETCEALALGGLHVVAIARRKDRLEALQLHMHDLGITQSAFLPIVCDITKEAEVAMLPRIVAKRWPGSGIDVLVNNAGLARDDASLFEGSVASWVEMLSTNVLGACLCTKAVLQDMESRNTYGHIINMIGLSGHRIPDGPQGGGFYCATKAAVKAITEGLRQEARGRSLPLRVSGISAGMVETEFFAVRAFGDESAAARATSAFKCLQPQDIAQAVVWCLSAPAHVEVNDIVIRPTEQMV